jgi:hypothetical protein
VDLEQPYFDLIADERTVRCTGGHFLGSAAPGPQSWLWAWANPGDYRAELMAVAHEVREFGELRRARCVHGDDGATRRQPGSTRDVHSA